MEQVEGQCRGTLHYIYKNYTFVLKNRKKKANYFHCAKSKCNARLIQKGNEFIEKVPHNHEASMLDIEIMKFRQELNRRALLQSGSLKKIYHQVAEKFPNAATAIRFSSVESRMRRIRNKVRTSFSTEYADLPNSISRIIKRENGNSDLETNQDTDDFETEIMPIIKTPQIKNDTRSLTEGQKANDHFYEPETSDNNYGESLIISSYNGDFLEDIHQMKVAILREELEAIREKRRLQRKLFAIKITAAQAKRNYFYTKLSSYDSN